MSNFNYTVEVLRSLKKRRTDATNKFRAATRSATASYYASRISDLNREIEAIGKHFVDLWAERIGERLPVHTAFILSCLSNDVDVDPYVYELLQTYFRGRSDTFTALSASIVSDVISWADAGGTDYRRRFELDRNDDFARTEEDFWEFEDDTWYCEYCDGRHYNDKDQTSVVTTYYNGRYTHSEFCNEADFFYCEISCENWDSNEFTSGETDDNDTICEEWARRNGWSQNRHGDWCEESDDDIPDYHDGDRSAIRAALDAMRYQSLDNRLDRRYGIEMEVHFGCGSDAVAWYHEHSESDACIERDGSLDDECGVEIISPPIRLRDHRTGSWYTRLLADARDHGARGWSYRGSYGCHVNVDLRGVTDQQVALFVALINNLSPLYQLLSGRKQVYNADGSNGGYEKVARFDTQQRFLGVGDFVDMGSKYRAVRVANLNSPNERFAEVRTFGSNLRPNAMLEYIELVDATLCYAQYLSKIPYQLDLFDDSLVVYPIAEAFNDAHKGFLNWLPEEYTALRSFLAHWNIEVTTPLFKIEEKVNANART